MFKQIFFAVLFALFSMSVFPAERGKNYIGIGVTAVKDVSSPELLSFEGSDARYSLNGLGASVTGESSNETANSIFFGGFLNDWVAIEVSYTQGLSSSRSIEAHFSGQSAKYVIESQREIRSLGASLLWTWKLAEKIHLFARTGMERRMVEDWQKLEFYYRDQSGTFVRASGADNDYRRKYDSGSYTGAGVTYFLREDVGIRLEHSARIGSITRTTLSLQYGW